MIKEYNLNDKKSYSEIMNLFEKENEFDYTQKFAYFEYNNYETEILVNLKNTVKVKFKSDNKEFILIYEKISNIEIINLLNNSEQIDLSGKYIENFCIDTLVLDQIKYLKKFKAVFTYLKNCNIFNSEKSNVVFSEEIDFRYSIISCDDFEFNENALACKKIDFSYCEFYLKRFILARKNCKSETIIFSHANFYVEEFDCYGTNFEKCILEFVKTTINSNEIDFREVLFSISNPKFIGTRFYAEKVDFRDSQFTDGDIDFYLSYFEADYVNFMGINLKNSYVGFVLSTFKESRVNFSHIKFDQNTVDFSKANFENSVFNFSDSYFTSGYTDFSNLNAKTTELIFRFGTFANILYFQNSKIKSLYFRDVSFNYEVNMQFGSIENLIFENCIIRDILRLEINNSEFNRFSLNNTVNLGKIYTSSVYEIVNSIKTFLFLEKAVNILTENELIEIKNIYHSIYVYEDSKMDFENDISIMSERAFSYDYDFKTYDESEIKKILEIIEACDYSQYTYTKEDLNNAWNKLFYDISLEELDQKNIELHFELFIVYVIAIKHYDLSQQFLLLKENFNSIGYYEEEDYVYVNYMNSYIKSEKFIKENNNFIKFFYKITMFFEYGTNPYKVFIVSIFDISIFSIIYFILIFFSSSERNLHRVVSTLAESIYLSGITFFTIGYGDVTPMNNFAENLKLVSYLLPVVQGFTGVFLMSYFVVALVRKTLR